MNFLSNWYKRYAAVRFDSSFEKRFREEVAKTELLRINLIVGTIGIGFLVGASSFFMMHEAAVFKTMRPAILFIFLNVFGLLIYELIARFYIARCL
ncbi:MAG: hypothetical protein ACHQD9_06225, partial [Chitinophagales bacterium]